MAVCRPCAQQGLVEPTTGPYGEVCWRCEHEPYRLQLEAQRNRLRLIEVFWGGPKSPFLGRGLPNTPWLCRLQAARVRV